MLSNPNSAVDRVTQIQNDYFFQVNLADVLNLGTSPTSVELFCASGSVEQQHLAFCNSLKCHHKKEMSTPQTFIACKTVKLIQMPSAL